MYADAAAREAVRYLTRQGGPEDGFWIHLDADVLEYLCIATLPET
jgi:hypothetical protein